MEKTKDDSTVDWAKIINALRMSDTSKRYNECDADATPEKMLLVAILTRAARDAVSVDGEKMWLGKQNMVNVKKDAREWFGLDEPLPNNEKSTEWFSFADVCDALELCPIKIHKSLRALEIEIFETADRLYLSTGHMGFFRKVAS